MKPSNETTMRQPGSTLSREGSERILSLTMWATNFLWATKKTVSDKCSCERQNSDTRSNFKKCERQKKYGIQDRIAVSDKKNMWATKKIWDTRSNCRERQKEHVSDKKTWERQKNMGYKIDKTGATKNRKQRSTKNQFVARATKQGATKKQGAKRARRKTSSTSETSKPIGNWR